MTMWHVAERYCHSLGAELVSIESLIEYGSISGWIQDCKFVYQHIVIGVTVLLKMAFIETR